MRRTPASVRSISRILLHIELPLVLLQALAVLASYLYMREYDLPRALILYPRILPELIFPLLIALFTVLLTDRLSAKES